jgi:hypothetical protein
MAPCRKSSVATSERLPIGCGNIDVKNLDTESRHQWPGLELRSVAG